MSFVISAQALSACLPDGEFLFQNFYFNIGHEKVGLIGKNGIGKSTLLKIITKEMEPHSGTITTNGKIAYLPQKLNNFSGQNIASILNIELKLNALNKAELGLATENDLNIIQDDWDFKNEVNTVLMLLHIEYLNLNRLAETLSGGELTRILFARLLLEKPDFLVLDEPTNNLDSDSKRQIFNFLDSYNKGMLIVSHDRELLNKMDKIIEISNLGLKTYGGNFDFYLNECKIEDEAAAHKLQNAEEKFKKQKKLAKEIHDKQFHKLALGKKIEMRGGLSALEIGYKKRAAENSAAKIKNVHEEKTEKYLQQIETEKENIREKYNINIDIEESKIPANKEMVICKNVNHKFIDSNEFLWKKNINIEIIGNKRVSILGKNGSGKTTLIHLITKQLLATIGEVKIGTSHVVVLDQNCSLLHEELTILENMQKFAPNNMKEHEVRIRAGRFLFYGDDVFKKVKCLSGGERLRVALACLLATGNAPDIFILDEPTNNLDLNSIEVLTNSLNKFQGTLIVISHDQYFLNDIKIDTNIFL